MDKKKVAFICVHNSCRSQIAEALGRHFVGNKFDKYLKAIILCNIMATENRSAKMIDVIIYRHAHTKNLVR